MRNRKGIVITSLILFLAMTLAFILSLQKSNINPPPPFYDFPENKLWAHRVNTEQEAHELQNEFNGIEIDVHYWVSDNNYYAGHDSSNGTNLESYFKSTTGSEKYYWIDLKNIDDKKISGAVHKMKEIILTYNLKGRVIVELSNAAFLSKFKEAGIPACLAIHDLTHLFIPYFAEQKQMRKIESDLEKYHFDALSAHYKMYSFLKKYFPQYNIHLWTNGLITEADKQIIKDLSHEPGVKVILVDYKENFLAKEN